MILEAIFTLISTLVMFVFGFINLPAAPDGALNAINSFFDLIFNNLGFLGFFVNIGTLKAVASVAIALLIFEDLYKVTMWVYHKLPISSN